MIFPGRASLACTAHPCPLAICPAPGTSSRPPRSPARQRPPTAPPCPAATEAELQRVRLRQAAGSQRKKTNQKPNIAGLRKQKQMSCLKRCSDLRPVEI